VRANERYHTAASTEASSGASGETSSHREKRGVEILNGPKTRKRALTERARRADAQLWRADDLGADLLRGRFADFAYDVHSHDTACLALITAGAIRIRMRGAEFVAQAGDLYAIDVDEPHAGWPIDADGWSQRTIYVELARLESLIEDHDRQGVGLSLRGPIIRDAGLSRLFYDLHRASEEDRAPLRRDERYLDFAEILFSRHVREAPQRVRRAARTAPFAVRATILTTISKTAFVSWISQRRPVFHRSVSIARSSKPWG
jgi:hypothetical protein